MPDLATFYRRIESLEDPSVDRAMAAALPTAEHGAQRLLVPALLRRNRTEGTTGLILNYHLLPDDLQQAIDLQAADLFGPLRLIAC